LLHRCDEVRNELELIGIVGPEPGNIRYEFRVFLDSSIRNFETAVGRTKGYFDVSRCWPSTMSNEGAACLPSMPI
jgi:hypothetical protein